MRTCGSDRDLIRCELLLWTWAPQPNPSVLAAPAPSYLAYSTGLKTSPNHFQRAKDNIKNHPHAQTSFDFLFRIPHKRTYFSFFAQIVRTSPVLNILALVTAFCDAPWRTLPALFRRSFINLSRYSNLSFFKYLSILTNQLPGMAKTQNSKNRATRNKRWTLVAFAEGITKMYNTKKVVLRNEDVVLYQHTQRYDWIHLYRTIHSSDPRNFSQPSTSVLSINSWTTLLKSENPRQASFYPPVAFTASLIFYLWYYEVWNSENILLCDFWCARPIFWNKKIRARAKNRYTCSHCTKIRYMLKPSKERAPRAVFLAHEKALFIY